MNKSLTSIALVGLLFISGCFHTKISTGLPASSEVIDIPFAHSFVYGLVPPDEIRAATQCPNGVSLVETKISFVNGLVAALTFSLYTPMHITVTCAAGGSAALPVETNYVTINSDVSEEALNEAFNKAAELSKETNQPVYFIYDEVSPE